MADGANSRRARGFHWKALGYVTSIASVLFLGAAAWQKEHPLWWFHPAIIVGMATSVLGMGFRYKSHLEEQREVENAEAEAKQPPKD